jgi:hypothetical protein
MLHIRELVHEPPVGTQPDAQVPLEGPLAPPAEQVWLRWTNKHPNLARAHTECGAGDQRQVPGRAPAASIAQASATIGEGVARRAKRRELRADIARRASATVRAERGTRHTQLLSATPKHNKREVNFQKLAVEGEREGGSGCTSHSQCGGLRTDHNCFRH